ncbi:LPXTG cell wall anchor domain-containing protein [Lactobacillus kitasatonis]|uniref:LPXTG cell wall anchor domain-containing protein n=1 Tax=Lactobacillus kitasatonis TaxID=237446 RepID=UPI0026EBB8EA|nr:LPXTG cell wall anchor domain-containing protein [Lactobacillus kitasatonis]
MRKILVGIAFFCFLSFAQGVRTVQAAVMDVSDNFVSLKVDKKRAKFNDDFVHVQAKFSDRRQAFTANSLMKITWENVDGASLQGIKENNRLVIQDEVGRDHEVGQYVVDRDGVVVLFNENIEDFENVTGQIDFDLQVKNKSERGQTLFIQAGDVTKFLHVVGQNNPVEEISSVDINGIFDQDNISWKIKIDPKKAEYDQVVVENAIPEGLIWDEKSLKVQVANHEIKFDKENPKINQNNLTLTLDGKKYRGPISISYVTQVKDYTALGAVNQVAVSYKLNDETTNQNIYGGKIQDEGITSIFGKLLETQETGKKNIRYGEKATRIRRTDGNEVLVARNADGRREEKADTESGNKELKLPVTGLTGFDNKPTTISRPKARHSDKDFKTVADKILDDDDLKEVSFKKHNRHRNRTSSASLPKAGESASLFLSIIGLFALIVGALTLGLKKEK